MRRILPHLAWLLVTLMVAGCAGAGNSDPVLLQAAETYPQITSYRVVGNMVLAGAGSLDMIMDYAAPDRYHVRLIDKEQQVTDEMIMVNTMLFGRGEARPASGQPGQESIGKPLEPLKALNVESIGKLPDTFRWQVIEPESARGRYLKELVELAKMRNVGRTTAEPVGQQVINRTPCQLYRSPMRDGQMLSCLEATYGVLLKTEILRLDRSLSYTYGNFNGPVTIELPLKAIGLP